MGAPIFGRVLTAMVTPFTDSGALDLGASKKLAAHLVGAMCNDALVLNGTTGEAPTTTDAEKAQLISAVRAEVGAGVALIAGVGTFDTAHSIELARQAEQAGADALLVVAPYYSRPPQAGLVEHFVAIADATELPVMIYDIPKRAGVEVSEASMLALAAHPKIVAVKDAKGNLASSAKVIAATDLAYYSGDDAYTPALLSVGGVGLIGTSTHFTGALTSQYIEDFLSGRVSQALQKFQQLLPIYTGVFATQGCMLVKSGLAHIGLGVGGLRPPMCLPTLEEEASFNALLDAFNALG